MDVCAEAGWLATAVAIMQLVQGLLQVPPTLAPGPTALRFSSRMPCCGSVFQDTLPHAADAVAAAHLLLGACCGLRFLSQ